MMFKKLILLTSFGLFAAQTPVLQASEEQKQTSWTDTTPKHIIMWSGAAACAILAAAAIYYVPSTLKNLNEASCKLNTQTVPAFTNAGIATTNSVDAIVNIVYDFSSWLKDALKNSLTFNVNQGRLERIAEIASRELPLHTGF